MSYTGSWEPLVDYNYVLEEVMLLTVIWIYGTFKDLEIMRITRWNKITLIDDEMYKDVKKNYRYQSKFWQKSCVNCQDDLNNLTLSFLFWWIEFEKDAF
jgi:hypothetical protein